MPNNKFEGFLSSLGYNSKDIKYTQEPEHSIEKMHELEVKYHTSSEDIINYNFKLREKIPYEVIKQWLSYIDTAQYFNEWERRKTRWCLIELYQ